jgi:deferrochelatase/peroxidase EfeB
LHDDVDLANDNTRNNNFTFNHPEIPGFDFATNQTNCPFSAHIRKTHPRADLKSENTTHHIMRAGIPYGPEVTDAEASAQKSSTDASLERGLAFVAYQANITQGFQFMQESWVNNANFIFGKTPL